MKNIFLLIFALILIPFNLNAAEQDPVWSYGESKVTGSDDNWSYGESAVETEVVMPPDGTIFYVR